MPKFGRLWQHKYTQHTLQAAEIKINLMIDVPQRKEERGRKLRLATVVSGSKRVSRVTRRLFERKKSPLSTVSLHPFVGLLTRFLDFFKNKMETIRNYLGVLSFPRQTSSSFRTCTWRLWQRHFLSFSSETSLLKLIRCLKALTLFATLH